MIALVLLRAAAQNVPSGESLSPTGIIAGILRFTLEYHYCPNLAIETERMKNLLGGDGFTLRSHPADDPEMLLLEFSIERTQSTHFLFAQAQELAEVLSLVSCTPDVDPGYAIGDEMMRDMPESIGGLVAHFCDSKAPAPNDPLWSVKAVGADRAWVRFGTRGEGILVAQPDTGVATHAELERGLDLDAGLDVIQGSGLPIDPLADQGGNPGHGTATSSCIVSPEAGRISGTAPGCTLVPIRAITNVVLSSGAAIAAAIDHARLKGCHVVTMSLGGPIAFPDLRRAINRAVAADMIVLAAAGNCVSLVVYPAWDRQVIAVAGVDAADRRWRGSSHGPAVDIAAPGENVYVARRSRVTDPDLTLVAPGQGTSFAVATTAGCAALWLAHHGPDMVRAEARRRGSTVQALFRAALIKTARRPAGWPAGMGAGVVDCVALLDLPLADIPMPTPKMSGHPLVSAIGGAFDWTRFGAEAGFHAFDHSLRSDPERMGAVESPVVPRLSPELKAALAAAGAAGAALFPTPALLTGLTTPPMNPKQALRIVAGNRLDQTNQGDVIESNVPATEAAARTYLGAKGGKELVEHAREVLEKFDNATDTVPEAPKLRAELLADLPEALKALGEGASLASLSPRAQVATEALIRMTGRPALLITDGEIDENNPEIGDWMVLLKKREQLKCFYDAVGRIDVEVDGEHKHAGTGFMVADGLVMTNRHVIDVFAEPMPSAGGGIEFLLAAPVSIAFQFCGKQAKERFKVARVVAAGSHRIGAHADASRLDMALLEVVTSAGQTLPAVQLLGDMPTDHGRNIAVVGFPAAPKRRAVIDPDSGQVSLAIIDRLAAIFQDRYGEKHVTPGDIDLRVGSVAGDVKKWIFSHDCTTLQGNSGSAVIQFENLHIAGLHFGGSPLRQNLAHSIADVYKVAATGEMIAPNILTRLNWRPTP